MGGWGLYETLHCYILGIRLRYLPTVMKQGPSESSVGEGLWCVRCAGIFASLPCATGPKTAVDELPFQLFAAFFRSDGKNVQAVLRCWLVFFAFLCVWIRLGGKCFWVAAGRVE